MNSSILVWKPTEYSDFEDNKHFRNTKEELDIVLATKPNASLLGSPTVSSPFPFGLWIWNAFNPSNTKLSRWIVKAFGSQPVLMSYANPALHESVGEATLAKEVTSTEISATSLSLRRILRR